MSNKILCKFHDDTEPSMHVYQNGTKVVGYCFVCTSMVNLEPGEVEGMAGPLRSYKEPTNIKERLEYIKKLPLRKIRGLDLPFDQLGYYLVYPTNDYYKRRNWGDGRERYTAPTGRRPPLFDVPGEGNHLIVVEGEFNAVTLSKVIQPGSKIVSPGPASEFMRYIKFYLSYKYITIIADHDAPGIVFGCQLKEMLHKAGKYCILNTVETDYNQLLQDGGLEAVRLSFQGVK